MEGCGGGTDAEGGGVDEGDVDRRVRKNNADERVRKNDADERYVDEGVKVWMKEMWNRGWRCG